MTLVIGTDEAGYGPNLGPLVVAATAWRMQDPAPANHRGDDPDRDLDHRLTAAVSAGSPPGGPLWADSKQIYRGRNGMAALERSAVCGLALAAGRIPRCWGDLTEILAAAPPTALPLDYSSLEDMRLPIAATVSDCEAHARRLQPALEAAGIALLAVAARAVYPQAFNAALDRGLNKSDILSSSTLELAAELHARHGRPAEPATIWCDRHGGRKRYAAVVSHAFAGCPVWPVLEAHDCSRYAIDTAEGSHIDPAGDRPTRSPTLIRFTVGGEASIPVAVASLTAKYVRELTMRAFNTFWCSRHPGLAPTAGYPVDALRWRSEGAASVSASGLPLDAIWRRA
jgi:hypothetical protein